MWLFTTRGFFSVTKSPTHPGMMQIRAREKADLVELLEHSSIAAPRIVTTPEPADYRFRIVVDRMELATIMQELISSIDYKNFKGAVHANPNQTHKHTPYLRVWSVMKGLQDQPKQGLFFPFDDHHDGGPELPFAGALNNPLQKKTRKRK